MAETLRALAAVALATLSAACATAATGARDGSGFPRPDRPVAEIVSPIWANEADRDRVRETEQVFAAAGVRPGMTVADIGAGSGYYVVRLSPVVGPAGRVIAQDVAADYMRDLQARVTGLGLRNVEYVLGTGDDPKLPAASVDLALMIHMYHEIEQPYGLLHRLAGSMKPGGLVAIVDSDAPPERHGTPPALLDCEMKAVGYSRVSIRTLSGGVGYLALYRPPQVSALPAPGRIKACSA